MSHVFTWFFRARQKERFLGPYSYTCTPPIVYLGNFNDLLCVTDKEDNLPHSLSLLEGFRSVVEDYQLTELELCGGKFTWEKERGSNGWVKDRLDMAFFIVSWWSKFPLCNLRVVHIIFGS